jgi:hypothetical protein
MLLQATNENVSHNKTQNGYSEEADHSSLFELDQVKSAEQKVPQK